MPSMREVAKQAGVSVATVSRVFNGQQSVNSELRDRVLRAAGSSDYVPAVGKKNPERIAMLYLGPFLLDSPYDSACFDGLSTAMQRSKYDLVLLDIRRDRIEGESMRHFFARKGVCGAVVRSTVEQRVEVAQMAAEGVPFVLLGDHFDDDSINFTYARSNDASREAIEHLLALGHQRIAFVSCDRDDGDHTDRFQAYRSVLEREGLFRESDVYRIPPSRMDGAPLVRRVLSNADRPTALFIADPMVAVGVINEAHHMGVDIPGDLSIIGFDDSDTRNTVFPRMSAVCQDSRLIGETAFDSVRQLIDAGAGEATLPKPPEAWFEIHGTSAPPPAEVKPFFPAPVSRKIR